MSTRDVIQIFKKSYKRKPWYYRFFFWCLSPYLAAAFTGILHSEEATNERINRLLSISKQAWFFKSIFGLLAPFVQSVTEACLSSYSVNARTQVLDLNDAHIKGNDLPDLVLAFYNSSYAELRLEARRDGTSSSIKKRKKIGNFIRGLEIKPLADVLPFTQLQVLNLAGHPLKIEGICELAAILPKTRLHHLNLSRTDTSAEALRVLLAAAKYSPLKTLNLSFNPLMDAGLNELALGLEGTRIETLDLTQVNADEKFEPKTFKIFMTNIIKTSLKTLKLNSNHLTHKYFKDLTTPNFTLESLDLSDNDQIFWKKTCMPFFACYLSKALKILYLEKNDITADEIRMIAPCLKHSSIEELHFSKNEIDHDDALKMLVPFLNPNLITLRLAHNYLEIQGALEVYDNGRGRSKSLPVLISYLYRAHRLKTLDLSFNEDMNPNDLRKLAIALNRTSIETLLLGGNYPTAVSFKALKANIKGTKVKILSLFASRMKASCLGHLNLKDSHVTTLDLSSVAMRDKGIKSLMPGLKRSSVKTLILNDNKVTDKGVKHLVHGIHGTKVTWLALSKNKIGDKGAYALIVHLKNLQGLDLSYNALSENGVIRAVQALKNSKITTIDLSQNKDPIHFLECERVAEGITPGGIAPNATVIYKPHQDCHRRMAKALYANNLFFLEAEQALHRVISSMKEDYKKSKKVSFDHYFKALSELFPKNISFSRKNNYFNKLHDEYKYLWGEQSQKGSWFKQCSEYKQLQRCYGRPIQDTTNYFFEALDRKSGP